MQWEDQEHQLKDLYLVATTPNGYLALTESWNGTSWTEVADLSTARYGLGGQGATSKSGLAFAGNTPASDPAGVTSTEEWTIPEALKTLTSTNA